MILVTGASGFVGAALTRALSTSGATVRALYHHNAPTAEMQSWRGVSWQQADLLDIFSVEEVMDGISEVYHCAAVVSFIRNRKPEMMHVNAETTANVVNAALDAGVRKLVYFSSVAALGRDGIAREITEEAQWEESGYNSGYAQSKQAAEMEVWRGIGEGLDAVILNPGIILGVPPNPTGWDNGSARMMQNAWKEFPFYTDGISSFVDVADVVTAATALMSSTVTAARFILSAGNFSFQEIFTKMAVALGRRPPRYRAGRLAGAAVWRLSAVAAAVTGKRPFITKETARNAQLQAFYNGHKIVDTLPGFAYTAMDETIGTMAKAFLARRMA